MSALDDKPFPKAPLVAAITLVLASVGAVAAAQGGLIGTRASASEESVTAKPVISRDVRFHDRADGAVVVEAVGQGPDTIVDAGTGGFVRGVVRGMARDRKSRGIGQDPVFRLSQWSDGRLTIEDTATGRVLDMNAFGPTNRQAFIDLLAPAGQA